jgi:hypothetical protein
MNFLAFDSNVLKSKSFFVRFTRALNGILVPPGLGFLIYGFSLPYLPTPEQTPLWLSLVILVGALFLIRLAPFVACSFSDKQHLWLLPVGFLLVGLFHRGDASVILTTLACVLLGALGVAYLMKMGNGDEG